MMTPAERIESVPIAMRHPAWRWSAALMVAADPANTIGSVSAFSSDTYISRAIKFCREKQNPINTGGTVYWKRYPHIYEAYLINMSANPNGGYKWQLEAMLMTDATLSDISSNFMFNGGEDTVRAYAKLFFDITPYKDKPNCILGNVLCASMSAGVGIDDYDYSWKAFAYTKGYDNLLKFLKFRTGSRLPAQLKNWFDEITQDRVSYGAYATTARIRNLYNQQALQVLDVASRYYTVSHSILQKAAAGDNDAALAATQILNALQDVILNPSIEAQIASTTDKHEPLIFSQPVSKTQD